MNLNVSAVVLTHNSAKTLKRCLVSLRWCAEIVLVDDNSSDETLKIAKQFSARVFPRKLNGNWAAQRNFALGLTQNDWVLFVDSDEVVTPALRQEIKTALKLQNVHGFFLPRKDLFLGQYLQFGETSQVRLVRLANKRFGRWTRRVHENWIVSRPLCQLRQPLLHLRDLSLSGFITRLNTYTSLETLPFHWWDLCKPKLKFIYNYVFLGGLLDGFAGFVMAYMMSLNSLITRVKSWEKQHHFSN